MLDFLRMRNQMKRKDEIIKMQGDLIQKEISKLSLKFMELDPSKVYYVCLEDDSKEFIALIRKAFELLQWTPPQIICGNKKIKLYKDVKTKSKR